MDAKALNLLIGSSSPAPFASLDNVRRTPNKREALYKKAGLGAVKEKTRAKTMASRNLRRNQLTMARRGIPQNLSDDDEDLKDAKGMTEKPKKKVTDRQKQLEEYRKQKEAKKLAESKSKKPPFRVGVYHDFDSNNKSNPWVKTSLKKNQVFVFKGNKTETTSKVRTRSAKNQQVPKPNIEAPIEEDVPKQNIVQELEQLNVNENEIDEEAEEAKDHVPEEIIFRTPQRRPATPRLIADPLKMATPPMMTTSPKMATPKMATPKMATPKMATPKIATPKVEFVTPKMKVMLERGTNSDKRRQNKGKTPSKTPAEILNLDDLENKENEEIMTDNGTLEEKKDVAYFKRVLGETNDRLTAKCQEWENKMEALDKGMAKYEDVCGTIRLTIGKANLLMNKKGRFEQFRGLIHNCEHGLGEKETTCMDLQGFWEMIFFQVEDVDEKFKELEEQESKNWITEQKKVGVKAKVSKKSPISKPLKPKAKASSNLRAMLAEKRKAMAKKVPDIVVQDMDDPKEKAKEEVTFEAGFFNVKASPKVSPFVEQRTLAKSVDRSANRKSDGDALRKSILAKRVSMSCGAGNNPSTPLAIIAATKSIRRSLSRENSPVIKAQLDYDVDDEETGQKENTESPLTSLLGPSRKSFAVPIDNLMSFESPVRTPRRSTRLSSARRINYNEGELFRNCVQGASPNLK